VYKRKTVILILCLAFAEFGTAFLSGASGRLQSGQASSRSSAVEHFHKVPKKLFPRSVLKHLCSDAAESESDCLESFQESGQVWAGDVNDDGINELLIYPGPDWSGTAGDTYILYQRQARKWTPLYPNQGYFGWQVPDPRFDILPVLHGGYHDLRVSTDWCLKWDGEKYVDYEASDYHKLSPDFFNRSNWYEAGIFWNIHYTGLRHVRIKPQWFTIPSDFSTRGRVNAKIEDSEQGVVWTALFKGGVWGVRGSRAFLLLPQPAYKGSEQMEIDGDWLVIHGEIEDFSTPPPVVARYNRRTKELQIVKGTSAGDPPRQPD